MTRRATSAPKAHARRPALRARPTGPGACAPPARWHTDRWGRRAALAALLGLALGCGTTRVTDTQRAATEQLLISNAVDQAVSHLDFRQLARQPVYLDAQYLDGALDKGYVVSSLRQHLLACGCLLQEDRAKATYVVEARAGGVGTDRHSVLVGIPQTQVPTLVPGQSATIPELPLVKKSDQNGVAKIAVFAYNRKTGQPVFQSGVVQALSTSRDFWVLGAGPFQNGTIRDSVTFAGEHLPFAGQTADGKPAPVVPVTRAALWKETPRAAPAAKDASGPGNALTRKAPASPPLAAAATPGIAKGGQPSTSPEDGRKAPDGGTPAAGAEPPPPLNAGGKDETQPARVMISGLSAKPD